MHNYSFKFDRSDIGLDNWREQPYSRWSFSNVNEIVPTAIARCHHREKAEERLSDTSALQTEITIAGKKQTLQAFLEYSQTDLFLGWQDGKYLYQYAAPHAGWNKPHIIFSISKSISAILAGILEDQGLIDPSKTIGHYLPETLAGGYGDCTIRHLLDMRVSLAFSEEYLNQDGDYARYRRATLWNPSVSGTPVETLKELLFSLQKGDGEHGRAFRYLSPNSDMLGLLLEKVSGKRYCDLFSQLLLNPIGASCDAHMTVDANGSPRGAGGISVTADDLLRIGRLLLEDGTVNGRQIISSQWIADMRSAGDDDAWKNGDFAHFIEGGRYRSKWYQMPRDMDAFLAIGIHGQWLYIDRNSRAVFVKLSSQAIPQDDALDEQCLQMFKQLSAFGR